LSLPDTSTQRIFWLRGDAGVGKSIATASLVQRYVTRHNSDIALFWCKYDLPHFSDALQLVKTLALHLSRISAVFARTLLTIPDLVNTLQQLEDRGKDNPTEIVDRLLVAPLSLCKTEMEKKNSASAPILVVIDGLGMIFLSFFFLLI
jgi:hypothetical protein